MQQKYIHTCKQKDRDRHTYTHPIVFLTLLEITPLGSFEYVFNTSCLFTCDNAIYMPEALIWGNSSGLFKLSSFVR